MQSDYYKLRKQATDLVRDMKDAIYRQLIQGTTHCVEKFGEKG
jgi:hypothetical protein